LKKQKIICLPFQAYVQRETLLLEGGDKQDENRNIRRAQGDKKKDKKQKQSDHFMPPPKTQEAPREHRISMTTAELTIINAFSAKEDLGTEISSRFFIL
jgi:hypothetical protein